MKLSYIKNAGSNDGDIIQAENYTAKMDLLPRNEEMTVYNNMLTKNISTIKKAIYSPYLIHNVNNDLDSMYNGMSILFINKSNNIFLEEGLEIYGPNSRYGLVGVVDILNDYTYSGSSTTIGTQNLKESSKFISNGKYMNIHAVVDFPTHACNGSIDRILFMPTMSHSNHKNCSYKDIRYPHPLLTNIHAYMDTGLSSLVYSAIDSKGNYIIKLDSMYYYNFEGIIGKIPESNVRLDGSSSKYNLYYITCLNDQFYFSNSYGTTLHKVNIIKAEDEYGVKICEFEVGKETFTVIKPESEIYNIYNIMDMGEFYIMTTRNGSSSSSSTPRMIYKLDKSFNLISKVQLENTSNDLYGYGIKARLTENLLYIYNSVNVLLNMSTMTIIESNNGIFNGAFTPIHCSTNPNIKVAACNPTLYSRAASPTSGYNQPNSYAAICEFNYSRPIITIDLEEPLNKTNAETLKLIFDLEFKLED